MRLLLIEDDAVIARELALRWHARDWAVLGCTSLAAADEAVRDGGFDLVVLDRGLPDGDGLDWLARLRQRDRLTPVLVLTARDRVADRVQGLHAGADDYLVKPFAAEELDARVEVLTRRAAAARGELLQYGRLSWRGAEGQVLVDGRRLELSPREFEVLGLLMRRAPHVVPRRVLIDALAERNLDVGDSAAEVYVSRLRRRIAPAGLQILTVRGFGYRLALDEQDGPGLK
ncbi:response regulator transcription factor [Aquabacterium sp. J223]|uniref:response regulator n=1 Tax=Aquabacterium sp. J223 TaxID=2898431 RepID=UPI0021ADE657|nr:response regulator transcription factor [Aquabacterium sp. J223]UUX97221.1 response regulator transcription factor [Aquabacterium sp. J223]